MIEYLPAAIAILIAGGIAAGVHLREKRRDEAMESASRHLALRYQRRDPSLRDAPFAPILFRGRWRRTAQNSMRGVFAGVELWYLEIAYTRSTGKSTHVKRQSVCAFPLGDATLPAFRMRPERLPDKFLQRLGYRDIDFEHHPGFAAAYVVRGDAEDRVRRLFTRAVLDYFAEHRGWSVGLEEGWLLVYRGHVRIGPEELSTFLQDCVRIRALFTSG